MRNNLKSFRFFPILICCFIIRTTAVMAATTTINGAQAGPLAVSTGDIVNVTGTGNLTSIGSNNGVNGNSANNVTVTVANGGQINAQGVGNNGDFAPGIAGKTIDLGTGANITIAAGGSVYNTGRNGDGDDEEASAIYTGANATVNIAGTAETDDAAGGGYNHFTSAVNLGSGSSITVASTGLVQANDLDGEAFRLASNNTVTNAGTLQSTFLANNDTGVINASGASNTITNNGSIHANGGFDAIVLGSGSISTGNVLNLYGNSAITGNLRNDGAIGGALVNFGYTGLAADTSANDTITGNIGSTGNAWSGHVYGGTSTVTGNVTFNTLQVDSGANLDINGIYTQGNGTTLNEGVSSATSYGKIVTNTTAVVSSGSTVNVLVNGYVANNTAITVLNTGGNGIGSVPGTIITNSPLVSFTGAATGGNLVLTSSTASLGSIASDPNAKNVGTTLDNIPNPNSSVLSGAINGLFSATSSAQVNNGLNSLTSHVENAIPQVTKSTMDQFVSKTLAHGESGNTGVSTGSDMLQGMAVWAEGFGGQLHQDAQQFSNGYNATIGGLVFGVEKEITDLWKIGFSQGFSQEDIKGKDFANNTDANSYQSSLYAKFQEDSYYVDTAFSYGYNHYDNSRYVQDIGLTAVSNLDGQQFTTYVEGGYALNHGNWQITPLASFEYMRLNLPSYSENGAGAEDLNILAQDYNTAQTGIGFKIAYPVAVDHMNLLPEFKFKWLHDWADDPMENTATFSGGGSSFNTVGFTPDRNTYELGAKLTVFAAENITVTLNYTYDLRRNFDANLGYVNVKYSF